MVVDGDVAEETWRLPATPVLDCEREGFTIWAQTHFGILDLAVLDLDLRDKKEN